jgi:hypothetical protein
MTVELPFMCVCTRIGVLQLGPHIQISIKVNTVISVQNLLMWYEIISFITRTLRGDFIFQVIPYLMLPVPQIESTL